MVVKGGVGRGGVDGGCDVGGGCGGGDVVCFVAGLDFFFVFLRLKVRESSPCDQLQAVLKWWRG